MKRIISLLLILALLPACLAVPVLADETDESYWVELLDYGTVNNQFSNRITLSPSNVYTKTPVQITLPESYYVGCMDILFRTDDPDPAFDFGSAYAEVVDLGGGLYRAYGDRNTNIAVAYTQFGYTTGTYLEILSWKIYSANVYPVNVVFGGSNGAEGLFDTVHFTNSGTLSQSFVIDSESDAYNGGYFETTFQFNENWQAYDFIELVMYYGYGELSSISAVMNGVSVPVTVSDLYFNSDDPVSRTFTVRLDLRNLDKTASSHPILTIRGKAIAGTNSFSLYSALGFVVAPAPSLWAHWFKNLQSWLSSGFSSIVSGIDSLGDDLYIWISNMTGSLVGSLQDALELHQEALIASEEAQQIANRELMNVINDNLVTLNALCGQWFSTLNTNLKNFQTSVGTWFTTQTNALTSSIGTWGQSIIDSITSGADRIVDALTPDDDASGFQDKLNNSLGQLGQAGAAMDSVSRPNIGDVDFNVSAKVPESGFVFMASLVNVVYSNEVIGPMMLWFLTLGLASFAIFGRR